MRESLVALYRRYCEEWGTFAARSAESGKGAPDGTPAYGVQAAVMVSGCVIAPSGGPAAARMKRSMPGLWASAQAGGAHEY